MGSRGDVDAYYNKGFALLSGGYHEEALAYLDKGLSINPEDTKTWILKGSAYMELQKYAEANEAFDHVLMACPDDTDTLTSKAEALIYLGKFQEAETHCEKALKIEPNHYLALLHLRKIKEEQK